MGAGAFSENLIPLDIPGAFTFPPPPDNLDVEKASPEVLARHGLHWCLPHRRPHGDLIATRKKVLARPLLAKDCVVPRRDLALADRLGKTFRPTDRQISGNWAGCVLRGNWDQVEATWNVPYVKAPVDGDGPAPAGADGVWNSYSWIGLDGWPPFGTNDVLQAGVDQYVEPDGKPYYVPWYEWYVPGQSSPSYVNFTPIKDFTVSPGDTVFCNISYVENRAAGYVWVRNVTTSKYFGMRLDPPQGATLKGACAEWIMEAPGGGYPGVVLPEWDPPVNFTDCSGAGAGGAVANPQNGDVFDIVYFNAAVPNRTTKTITTLGVNNVTVAWFHS